MEQILEAKGKRLVLRRICPEEADAALALQTLVHEAMPNREHYVATTPEDLLETIRDDHVYGAFDGAQLIAVATSIRNRESPHNLGQACGEIPEHSYTYDAVFVHPEYRGLGLQRAFGKIILEQAVAEGAHFVWCTVSPQNRYSYDNLVRLGFSVYRKNVIMYGGNCRNIMKMELK